MSKTTEYISFLSFASEDEALGRDLHDLFKDMGEELYFSHTTLPQQGTPDWRKDIIDGISKSCSFINLHTRHSMDNQWVLYELGVAEALGKDIYRATVIGTSNVELSMPGKDVYNYDISNRDKLLNLVTNILHKKYEHEEKSRLEERVKRILSLSPSTDRILTQAGMRKIFFAGNIPAYDVEVELDKPIYNKENQYKFKKEISWYTTKKDYESRLTSFLEILTTSVLELGFRVTSCPQVDSVGGLVAKKATTWISEKRENIEIFQIGGIYPINRFIGEAGDFGPEFQKQWASHWLSFRKSYLSGHEWIILIGGSQGTKEEHEAAQQLGIQPYAVPCFGGYAAKIWSEIDDKFKVPCKSCRRKDGKCSANSVIEIAKFLENHYRTNDNKKIRKVKRRR